MNETNSDSGSNKQFNSETSLYAAGALVACLVLLAVFVLWPKSDSGSNEAEQAISDKLETDEEPATQKTISDNSDCPDDLPRSSEIPTQAPQARWELYRTIALPYSETYGPFKVKDGIASCYAQTPEGALIASLQAERAGVSGISEEEFNNLTEKINRGVYWPNEGLERRIKLVKERGMIQVPPNLLCNVAAFRFINYTPEETIISLAFSCPNTPGFNLSEVTMRWTENTWLLVLEPDGAESPTRVLVDDLDEMIRWGGI